MATISTHTVVKSLWLYINWIMQHIKWKICTCHPKRDLQTFNIGMSILASHLLKPWTTISRPRGFGPDLEKANLKWRWSPEHLSLATAGLSVPYVLGLSPAGSSRRCCKKRHPNIESLKRYLPKAAADFPVDMLRNSIDSWPQRLRDCVHANDGHCLRFWFTMHLCSSCD